jgi:2Fe-2S ferredoxin
MTTLTALPSGKTIEVAEGATLLSALLSLDLGLKPACDADPKCSSCHIFVQEGRKGLSKIAREENEKLDTIPGVGSKSRLACFVKVLGTEDIKVELLGFGSGI